MLIFLFSLLLGFEHAFEIDHLLAVSSIVAKRTNLWSAIKDGIFWGLGHTSTILLVGVVILVFQIIIPEHYFRYFEAIVGVMLVVLGAMRLYNVLLPDAGEGRHRKLHEMGVKHTHGLAYGVGLVHGLAGSGALVLLVMAQIKGAFASLIYLGLFGIGSIGGMLVAASIFSLPLSQKLLSSRKAQIVLVSISTLMCMGYGIWVAYKNIIL